MAFRLAPPVALVLLTQAVVVPAVGQTAPDERAAATCETAVVSTVKRMRGAAANEVRFSSAQRILDTVSGTEVGVKGAGQYRGRSGAWSPFTYTCAFNPASGGTSGVVVRDASPPTAQAQAPWQPDLRSLTPEACETAAASALQKRFPRATNINFGADTRALRPAADGNTSLQGEGSLVRATGMRPSHFSYRCEVDARSGKVLDLQLGD